MRPAARLLLLAVIAGGLGIGAWLAAKGTAPDRRNLDALVTVGGDAAHDALHPALDLTRLGSGEEVAIGEAIDAEVRARMPIGGDAPTEAYLSRVLRALTPHVSRGGIPYRIAVIRSKEVNAFAVPGGRVYVTEGMLGFAGSEAELAAVIGHEIGHVDLRHCVERLQFERAAGKVAPDIGALARLGYEVMLRGFSEEQELAADVYGAKMAARAAYDPWAARDLFARLLPREEERERKPTGNPVREAAAAIPEALSRYFATHPPADQRMEAVRRALDAETPLWRGQRRYAGRTNLAARRAMEEEARDDEWVVRGGAPD